jgi:uncharacterized protein (TIGR00106 family)
MLPLGVGTSVSKFLVPAIKKLERLGVRYEVTPMCTIFETENVEEAFNIVKAVHEAVFEENVKRVVTAVKIDDRRDIKRDEGKSRISEERGRKIILKGLARRNLFGVLARALCIEAQAKVE